MGRISSKSKSASHIDDGADVIFDHFQILRAIGKGSFGKVCIVQKKDSKQMYAMKYMNKSQCLEKDAVRNVLREIEILAMLDHPFLVNLWFSFQDAEDMFMVVDLLLGGDLRYHIQQSGRFDEKRVRFYVCEIALALDYLQMQHIVHRDIKPDNILLDEEGHVHITDFNIATVLHDGQLATSMTGTKPYMAPEVFDCALDECPGYSYPVDWWSLGVCTYEMLRSKRPFDIHSGTSITEIRQMFHDYNVHFSSSIQSGMRDLLRRLLCVNPRRRISSLNDISQLQYFSDVQFDEVLEKKLLPLYVPPKDHLNCDPTFELEEMIIEANPLHKKKKRLSKQNSKREQCNSVPGIENDPLIARLEEIQGDFKIYNRERELALQDLERKENEWQEELETHMESLDPHANYRKDLILPLASPGKLSPILPRSPLYNRSPFQTPDEQPMTGGRVSPKPLKWFVSPTQERPKLKPFESIDKSAFDSDSSTESFDYKDKPCAQSVTEEDEEIVCEFNAKNQDDVDTIEKAETSSDEPDLPKCMMENKNIIVGECEIQMNQPKNMDVETTVHSAPDTSESPDNLQSSYVNKHNLVAVKMHLEVASGT